GDRARRGALRHAPAGGARHQRACAQGGDGRAHGVRDRDRGRRQPRREEGSPRRGARDGSEERQERQARGGRVVSAIVSLTMLAETLRIATPYACAAVGGIWAERSGVIQIGLEGVLLTSAFSSVAVAATSGSAALGLVAGVASGALLSVVHGLLVEKARVHAVISGIALNLL